MSNRMLVSTIKSATHYPRFEVPSWQLLTSRECHQFIRGHRASPSEPGGMPKPSHDRLSPGWAFHGPTTGGFFQHHDALPDHKSDFRVRLDTELVADVDGNGDLTLAGDAHKKWPQGVLLNSVILYQ